MNTTPNDPRHSAPPQENLPQIQGDRRWEFESVVALNLREIGGGSRSSRRREEADRGQREGLGMSMNLDVERRALLGTTWGERSEPSNARRSGSWSRRSLSGRGILLALAAAGFRAFVAVAAACLLMVMLSGCLSRPPLARETFALTLPGAPESTNASGTAVLLLRSVVVAPMFDGKALVYRLGEHTWEQDPYAEFLVPPAAMLAGPLRTALRRSGVFRDVIEPGSALTPDRVAEIQVTEFCGDFRKKSEPAAVLALRCTIFDTGPKQPVRLQKEYARRLALPERTAAGVVAGWNEALGQILGELVADLQGR